MSRPNRHRTVVMLCLALGALAGWLAAGTGTGTVPPAPAGIDRSPAPQRVPEATGDHAPPTRVGIAGTPSAENDGPGDSRGLEVPVLASLRAIARAQERVLSAGGIDRDGDGRGEHGFLDEIVGSSVAGDEIRTRWVDAVFDDSGTRGVFTRDGYCFRVFLPGAAWSAVTGIDAPPAADHAEQAWTCYAWPEHYGITGTHAFFTSAAGQVLVTDNSVRRYSGTGTMPAGNAALDRETPGGLADAVAAPFGHDGQIWTGLDRRAPRPFAVQVVDTAGQPLSGLRIMVVEAEHASTHVRFRGPRDRQRLIPLGSNRMACGGGVTDGTGGLTVRGWPTASPALALLGVDGRPLPTEGVLVAWQDGITRIELPPYAAREARIHAAEEAAIRTLKHLVEQRERSRDPEPRSADAGRDAGRPAADRPADPARLWSSEVARDGGYLFRSFAAESTAAAGQYWRVYAWPVRHAQTGRRAFCVSQDGQVLACANRTRRYGGIEVQPSMDAAAAADSDDRFRWRQIANRPGRDGETWFRVH